MLLGVITGAHGVKGEVRVKSFTAEPDAIVAYGSLEDEQGSRRFTLAVRGRVRGQLIARVDGVVDRTAAERLKGTRLYVARSALPAPAPDEYYHADLVGLSAWLTDGSALGHVRAVHDFGAGASLEVEKTGGGSIMVPFTEEVVPQVDLAQGRLVVDPPAGLLDNRPVEAEGDV